MKKVILVFMLLFCIQNCRPVFAQRISFAYTDTTTMRAPATSAAVWCAGFTHITWDFKVATINTSVGVALQKKSGKGQWTCVFADSLVYTRNDNFSLCWNDALADSVRFKWISEGGGTNATITHNAQLSGGN